MIQAERGMFINVLHLTQISLRKRSLRGFKRKYTKQTLMHIGLILVKLDTKLRFDPKQKMPLMGNIYNNNR